MSKILLKKLFQISRLNIKICHAVCVKYAKYTKKYSHPLVTVSKMISQRNHLIISKLKSITHSSDILNVKKKSMTKQGQGIV